MDSVFVQGIAAFISSILVFCGSVWLLLAFVVGTRLAYFISASVTLAFLLIMGVVWSFGTPLGPVGILPSWESVGMAEDPSGIQFGPANEYPDGAWQAASPEDVAATTQAAELEGDALDVLADAIDEGKGLGFVNGSEAEVDKELTRLIEIDGEQYGAVTIKVRQLEAPTAQEEDTQVPESQQVEDVVVACEDAGGALNCPREAPKIGNPAPVPTVAEVERSNPNAQAIVVMKYDPGNPLGKARVITAGTFLLLAGHLFGLSRAERKAKENLAPEVA